MTNRLLLTALTFSIASTGALAADVIDTAKVVSTAPIVERVNEPRQECWNETVTGTAPTRERSLAGPILGGVAGAIIGHQVGRGSGNTVATAAGAVAGAVVGDRLGNSGAAATPVSRQEQHCRMVDSYRDVVRGYKVVYRYNGRDIATTLPYDPGRTVSVGVGVIDQGRMAGSNDGPPADFRYQ